MMGKDINIQNEVTTGEPLEKGGYFVAYNLVMRNAMKVFDLSTGEYSCLTMLFSYAGADKDKCFPSQETLAEDLNTTSRNVRRYLEALETKGAIVTYNRQNKKNLKISNIYDLSPCLSKIREIYCSDKEESPAEQGITVTKKSSKLGQDKFVLSDESVRTDSSYSTGQIRPTTSNTTQITNNITNNNDYIDDDKRTSPSETSAIHNEESIDLTISLLREYTKEDLTDRSYKSIVRKCVDKYNQGKVNSFRDYLATSLARHIEALEFRKIKESNKSGLAESNLMRQAKRSEALLEKSESKQIQDVPFYNWLEA